MAQRAAILAELPAKAAVAVELALAANAATGATRRAVALFAYEGVMLRVHSRRADPKHAGIDVHEHGTSSRWCVRLDVRSDCGVEIEEPALQTLPAAVHASREPPALILDRLATATGAFEWSQRASGALVITPRSAPAPLAVGHGGVLRVEVERIEGRRTRDATGAQALVSTTGTLRWARADARARRLRTH